MTSLNVQKLYERSETLQEAIKNETINEYSKEYEDIIETGSKGGHDEKLLAISFISVFFRFYPHLQLRAIDALFDCCQDENINIRIIAMKTLTSLCKSAKEHTVKVAGILSQLLQLEDTQEHLVTALCELIKIDPVVAIKGFFKQVASGEDEVQENCIKFIKEKFLTSGSSVITKEVEDFISGEIEALEAGGSMLKAEHPRDYLENEEIISQAVESVEEDSYTRKIKRSSQYSQEKDLKQLDGRSGLKHQTETLSKEEQVKNKLREFVEDFVCIYEMSLSEYYERLENQTAKPGKWADFINKGIETGKSGTEGIEVAEVKASTLMGINILQSIISSSGTWQNRNQLKTLTSQLYKFKEDPSGVREELVKCAVEVFQSFECQFTQVTADGSWERAIRKLAHDAINRAIHYYKEHGDEEFSASSIARGILLGRSKRYKHVSFGIPHIKRGHTLKHEHSNSWNTAEIFDKPGVVTVKSDGSVYNFQKRKDGRSDTSKYSYRLLFRWELEEPLQSEMKKYQKEDPPNKEYKYILKPSDQEKLKNELLDKINNQDPELMEKRLKENFKAGMDQIEKDAEKSFNQLDKYLSNNFKKLLSYIENHQNEIKEIFNRIVQQHERHHQEASQQREEIDRHIKDEHIKTRAEIKIVSQEINNLKDMKNNKEEIGSKDQHEKSIPFDVKQPVEWFTGRTEKLKELHEELQNKGEAVISQMVAITGLGGVGKSELARKYISIYSKEYNNNIIWINAESYGSLAESFRRLAQDKLGIPTINCDGKEKKIGSIVEDVYEFFSKGNSLFIFDNAEKRRSQDDDDDGIDKFLPSLPPDANKPHILITSRNQAWGKKPLTLDTFTEPESIEFIKKAFNIKDESLGNEIKNLAETLQHFPLALQQAVAYINKKIFNNGDLKSKINKYLMRYDQETEKLLDFQFPDDSSDLYTKTTFTTWKITTEKIKDIDKQAGEMLDIIAYFAPDGIPVQIFSESEMIDDTLLESVELLKKYSMVNSGQVKTVLNVHRLVQQVTRIELEGKGKNEEIIQKAFELLTQKFPYGGRTSEDYSKKRELSPHFEVFLSHIDKWRANLKQQKETDLIILLSRMIDGYFDQGNTRRLRQLLERKLAIEEKHYGPDHVQVANTLINLGIAHGDLGDTQKKKEFLERALEIQKKHYRPDQVEVAITLVNLGNAYGDLGETQKGKELLERALAIKQEHHGLDHIEVANTLVNLGIAYENLGETQKQKDLLERALLIQEKRYGPDHVEVANTLANLGIAYGVLGETQKRKELLERAFKIKKKHYGIDHFQVAKILVYLSSTYEDFGDTQKKKELLERALTIQEKHYGPDHYEVARTLVILGIANQTLGETQKGKELIERALAIQEKHYGPDHYEVAKTLVNLGNAYGDLGETQKGKELIERALPILETHYGRDHYDVTIALVNLGNAYGNLGETQKRKELLERALAIKQKHYGPDHVQVANTLVYLGYAYGDLGKTEKKKELIERALAIEERHNERNHFQIAITLVCLSSAYGDLRETQKEKELLERALAILEKHYGPDHFQVAITLVNLGKAYGNLGKTQKGKKLLERALAIQKKNYGPDHVQVANTLVNLGIVYGVLGDTQKKKELLEQALAVKQKYYGPNHFQLAITLVNLGNAYGDLGETQKGKELLERALAIQEKLYGPDHFKVAITLAFLGNAYEVLGDTQKGKELLERTLAIQVKHYGADHLQVAITLINLGNAYGDLGETQKKKELLERALAIEEKHYGPDHYEVAITLVNLGNAYGNLGETQKRKELLERALAIKQKHYGLDHVQVANTLVNLGYAYGDLGETEKKKELLERALAIEEKHYGPDHYEVAITLVNLGNAYGNLGETQKRKELLERALAIKQKHYGLDHVQVANTLVNLGYAYGDLGETEKKKELLERALAIEEKHYGPDHYEVAITLVNLGIVYEVLGDTQKEKEIFERALPIYERYNHPLVTELRRQLDKLGSLHFACKCGSLNMVKTLVEEGSDVLARNNHDTVLHQAVSSGNVEIIRLILEKIKERDPQKIYEHINAKDTEGDTPLMWAVEPGKTDAAKILLEYGVDLNVQNSGGETALHWAVQGGYHEIVHMLLNMKASPYIKNEDNKTPLDFAYEILDQDPENDDVKTTISLLLSITDESKSQHQDQQVSGSVSLEECLPE